KGVNGARRWIGLGFMSFQPSEVAKFAVVLYASDYMVRKMDVKERFFRAVLPMAAAVAVVVLLLLAEPDMGAFMVIAVIAMGILFLGGVNARMFLLIAAVMTIAFVLMTRRIIHIGRQAIALARARAGLVAQRGRPWMAFQAYINMGVNLGALPTTGLTLQLMSYCGSAVLMSAVALAVVLSIDF